MRLRGADRPQKYIAVSVCNNKWYENMVDIVECQVLFISMERATGNSLLFRSKKIDEILVSAKSAQQQSLQ